MKHVNKRVSRVLFCCLAMLYTASILAQTAPISGTASVNLGADQRTSPAAIVNIPVNIDITGMTALDAAQAVVPLVLGTYRLAIQYDNSLLQAQLTGGRVPGGTTFQFALPVNANILTDASNTETLIIHASQSSVLLPTGRVHIADIPFIVKARAAGQSATVSVFSMDLRTPVSTVAVPELSIIGGELIPNAVSSVVLSIDFADANADADADGLPDAWELAQFGVLSRDGRGDFDNDGVSDLAEFQAYSRYSRDGDASGDGLLNLVDMLLLQRHVNGYIVLPDSQKARLDLYPSLAPDGVLNIQDLIIVNRRLLGL